MTQSARRGLLPAGLRDVLPPEADHEAEIVNRLMAVCASYGYRRVKPPLVEFEDSLFAGAGAATAQAAFRLMDPVSQRMLGLRTDMTVQIARIAAARLRKLARPLRLSYAGEVLRVRGDELRPERQFGQVGVELIGSDSAAADAECILLAVAALQAIGIEHLTVDLSSPRLAPAVIAAASLDTLTAAKTRDALDRRDQGAVKRHSRGAGATLLELLKATGPADRALRAIEKLELPADAATEARRLAETVAVVRAAAPDLRLTIDPVEIRGFEYHTGLCFTVFARGVRGELGRGGRYMAGGEIAENDGEPATGFTLFMDSVLKGAAEPHVPRTVFAPLGAPVAATQDLRAKGWIIVAGLETAADPMAEARRMGCSHLLVDGAPREVR